MSGTGIGEAVALLLYGTGKLAAYAIGGAAWLTYHGVKASAKLIHQAYVANEARRRRNAMEELHGVTSEMARISEIQLAEIEKLEMEADKAFEAAADEMERSWRRSMSLTEKAEVHMDEALDEMSEWFTAQEAALKASFEREIQKYSEETASACERISAQIIAQTTERSKKAMEALEGVEDTLKAREERYHTYASRILREAKDLLEIMQRTYDCETFAPGELSAAKSALEETEKQLKDGVFEAAAGNASIAAQNVQFLQLYAEQRTSQFAREKMLVEHALTDLAEAARASHDLMGDTASPEIKEWLKEGDASFWSEKRLDSLWKKAEALHKKAEAFAYQGAVSSLALIHEVQELRLQIIREYNRTRLHVASRESVMELAEQLIDAHETVGWEMAEEATFLGGDCRNDVRLVFLKNGDMRIVLIHNDYDECAGVYTQQIIRFAEEAGEPDENVRHEEDELINQALSDQGVPENLQVHCDGSTFGQKASV